MMMSMLVVCVKVNMCVRSAVFVMVSVRVDLPAALSHCSPGRVYAERYQHQRNR